MWLAVVTGRPPAGGSPCSRVRVLQAAQNFVEQQAIGEDGGCGVESAPARYVAESAAGLLDDRHQGSQIPRSAPASRKASIWPAATSSAP